MQTMTTPEMLQNAHWPQIQQHLHQHGYAVIPHAIPHDICDDLKASYDRKAGYRKTVVMERYRFGLGEYKYFDYPLPPVIEALRNEVYPYLVPIANAWMQQLNINLQFPGSYADLKKLCHANGQQKPTVLILKYGIGGHNTLHQDLYGDIFFPLQMVIVLNEKDRDYIGGEFVLTQQTPRAQSKAIVLQPGKGDILIFTTNFKPVKGSKGYYRVNMKHGVSEVQAGERYTLGIIFHDALS